MIGVLSVYLILANPVIIQDVLDAKPTLSEPESDEIIVTGLKDIDDKDSIVNRRTLSSSRTGSAAASRALFGLSRRWARCAVDEDLKHQEWVRKVIDSRTNSSWQSFALSRLAQINVACAPSSQAAIEGRVTDPYYDRGALTIEVIKRYAPAVTLTRRETNDPAVQARFNAREVPLAKFRLPADRRYFETAVCFVRLQPELAAKLARTDGPLDAVRRLEAAIVNRGRLCVGNVKRVYFDGIQFRFYIADAVYRWTLAAEGRDTLMPE
jgi:hypothetical protein